MKLEEMKLDDSNEFLNALSKTEEDKLQELFNPPSDTFKVIRELLRDEMLNSLKNTPLWPVLTKSFVLTFLDDKEAKRLEFLFESYVCKWLRSLRPGDPKNKEIIDKIQQLRFIFLTNLNRARGTINSNKINERTAQISQIRFGMSSFNTPTQSGGPGFWSRLLGRFRR